MIKNLTSSGKLWKKYFLDFKKLIDVGVHSRENLQVSSQ